MRSERASRGVTEPPVGQDAHVEQLVVPSELCRNAIRDPQVALDGAVWLIEHMCEHLRVPDLGDVDVLDFGCGVRFTQAFLNRGVPVKQYIGVDVAPPVIEFLRSNVTDPRFEFHLIDAQNDLYNPNGVPLSDLRVPELEGRQFDLACLFSVFTHLAPNDYVSMLRLLRRYVRPKGWLFYTLFINEQTDGGYGYIDALARALGASTDPRVQEVLVARAREGNEPPDFIDDDPTRPLLRALYSRKHAIELIERTGWDLVSVSPPDVYLQHHIVCTAGD